ncbi:MAG: His-Xaa-Ser system radical SAM maturase HxsC [Leptospirales bacterium]
MDSALIHLDSRHNSPLGILNFTASFIAAVSRNSDLPFPLRKTRVLLTDQLPKAEDIKSWKMVLLKEGNLAEITEILENVWELAPELDYLDDGDVIKVTPKMNNIHVLYRRKANSNAFLVTEQCNSYCVMCSQPPKKVNDHYLVEDMLEALPLIDPGTKEIGITGGEPTLLGNDFFQLIRACKQHLPNTSLHVLSNGRKFDNRTFAQQVAEIRHPDLMIGIPLYADYSQLHDFIVQADNAFDETIRGILNLKLFQQKVEIRVVSHRQNYERLPRIAEFIARNLLFVDHVALMGMELMGFAKTNLEALWIDPYDYRNELEEAVRILDWYGMHVSIYNHPLCVINENVRHFAIKSISDWKNEYMPECSGCSKIQECGGFFSSALLRYSSHIVPMKM